MKIGKRYLESVMHMCTFTLLILTIIGFNIQKTFAATDTQTINGVTFTIVTDKDNYELGERAQVTVTIHNDNSYDVDTSDFEFELPEWINLEKYFAHQTIPAGQTVTLSTYVDLTFEDWETVQINDQNIRVGIRALYDTVKPDSTFHAQIIKEGTQEYKNLWNKVDNKNNIQHGCFLNLSLIQANGTSYSKLTNPVTIYIQVPNGWNEKDLQAIYASIGTDEQFEEKFVNIDGTRYLCFETTHFSPYLIANSSTASSTAIKTGDNNFSNYYILASVMLCILTVCLLCFGKKSLVLCVVILGAQYFAATPFNSALAVNNSGISVGKQGLAINLKIGKLTLDINMKILEKASRKTPHNIKISLKNNNLKIEMDDVQKGWCGSIFFEDLSGYDNYKKELRYKDLDRTNNSFKYKLNLDNLPAGTYNIKLYNNNNRLLCVKHNVVLNHKE